MKTILFIAAAVIILVLLMRSKKATAAQPAAGQTYTFISPTTGQVSTVQNASDNVSIFTGGGGMPAPSINMG